MFVFSIQRQNMYSYIFGLQKKHSKNAVRHKTPQFFEAKFLGLRRFNWDPFGLRPIGERPAKRQGSPRETPWFWWGVFGVCFCKVLTGDLGEFGGLKGRSFLCWLEVVQSDIVDGIYVFLFCGVGFLKLALLVFPFIVLHFMCIAMLCGKVVLFVAPPSKTDIVEIWKKEKANARPAHMDLPWMRRVEQKCSYLTLSMISWFVLLVDFSVCFIQKAFIGTLGCNSLSFIGPKLFRWDAEANFGRWRWRRVFCLDAEGRQCWWCVDFLNDLLAMFGLFLREGVLFMSLFKQILVKKVRFIHTARYYLLDAHASRSIVLKCFEGTFGHGSKRKALGTAGFGLFFPFYQQGWPKPIWLPSVSYFLLLLPLLLAHFNHSKPRCIPACWFHFFFTTLLGKTTRGWRKIFLDLGFKVPTRFLPIKPSKTI